VYEGVIQGGKKVAVKIVEIDKPKGVEFYAREYFLQREIKYLEMLNKLEDSGVVRLLNSNVMYIDERDMIRAKMIFELYDMDLTTLMKKRVLRSKEIVYLSYCIFKGTKNIHDLKILHRDLKPSNILIRNSKAKLEAVLSDLGLARHKSHCKYSPNVVTLWYRPPELLQISPNMERKYCFSVDVWSIGCMIAEMILGHSLFGESPNRGKSHNETTILRNIRAYFNVYDKDFLEGKDSDIVEEVDNYFKSCKEKIIRFSRRSLQVYQIFERSLIYDSSQRIRSSEAYEILKAQILQSSGEYT